MSSINEMGMVDAATYLANIGIIAHPLHPPTKTDCKNPGKQPIFTNWGRQEKPLTSGNIRHWFKNETNLGVVCGRYSNVTVVDIDTEIKPVIANLVMGFDTKEWVKQSHVDGRWHWIFQYDGDIPAGQYQLMGFDILSDGLVQDKDSDSMVVSGDNCVFSPSIHKDGTKYMIEGDLENRPRIPDQLKTRLINVIKEISGIQDALKKCRTCFKLFFKAVFMNKQSDLYRRMDIFRGADGRKRHLALMTELKANGATERQMLLICASIFNEGFDENKTIMEIRNIDETKTATNSTLKEDVFLSKFYTEGSSKKSSKKHYTDDDILSIDHAGERSRAFHVIAQEYLKENNLVYVAGELRKYDGGIYPASPEKIEMMKREVMDLAIERFNLPLAENYVMGVLKVIEMYTVKRADGCEPDNKNVIVFNNGVYNIKTKTLSPHDPKNVYFSKIPWDYVEDAPIPAMFNRYMESTFKGNESQKDLLQEMMGYCLTRHHAHQRIFYLLGDGGNGKGTFLYVLSKLLGAENMASFSLLQLTDHPQVDYNIAKLHGKQANICGDVGKKPIDNTEHIKKLSSGTDDVTGRHPYGRPFSFISHAKLIFAMNALPKKNAFTRGDKRRDVIISFINHISESDGEIRDLHAKIVESGEMAGIINWAIKGLLRLEENGDFSDKRTVAQRGLEYDEKSNPMRYYVEERITFALGNFLSSAEIHEDYTKFRISRGMPELSQEEIKKELIEECRQIGINSVTPHRQIVKKQRLRGFLNIKIIDKNDENVTARVDIMDRRGKVSSTLIRHEFDMAEPSQN